jgi:hypothetical protein
MRDTIDMAREAGGDDWDLFKDFMPEIERLVALVRADERSVEREACAKLCENIYTNGDGAECWLENAAEKIRNRGNT